MQPLSRDHVASATLTALVVLLLAWALVIGLRVRMPGPVPDALKLFGVGPPPPPPPVDKVEPRRSPSRRPEGRAAPPALRAQATAIASPPPVVPPPILSPVITAPVPNIGAQATQGAAEIPGPGTGAGGI
ncbi:MAG TPA: energy transducer TonB, partial [Sphingomonas sp.]